MYAKGRPPRAVLQIRKEYFYPMVIKNTIHGVLDAESIDVRASLAEFSSSMEDSLSLQQQYDFWTKFWRTIHEVSLSDYDSASQERIRLIRDYTTEKMNSVRSVVHPRY
jgi:hypothetical protein